MSLIGEIYEDWKHEREIFAPIKDDNSSNFSIKFLAGGKKTTLWIVGQTAMDLFTVSEEKSRYVNLETCDLQTCPQEIKKYIRSKVKKLIFKVA